MNPEESQVPQEPRSPRRWLAFGLVAGLLAISAVGLNAAVGIMRVQFQKLPVPLAASIESVPGQLGPWTQVSLDRRIDHATEETLGTQEYVFRTYVDRTKVKPEMLAKFKDLSEAERERLSRQVQAEHPDAVVRFALTYYTGSVDTVPHIPERCYTASGLDPIGAKEVVWPIFPSRPAGQRDMRVRSIQFEQQATAGGVAIGSTPEPKNVAYFFQVNGGYASDPISGVRLKLQDLTVRHGYFAKIELATTGRDRAVAATAMTDFLVHAMPAIEAVLPDWSKYEPGNQAKSKS